MSSSYALLKATHQGAAALSITGFVVRGVGMLRGAAWLQTRFVRITPHVVDTGLLASALAMAWVADFTPINSPWLAAKIVALLAYIALGTVALRPARPGRPDRPLALRAGAWVAALLVFGYIVSVAITKHAAGLTRWI